MTQPQKDWRHLAEEVSTEKDPRKMVGLVRELIHAIDEERKQKVFLHQSDDASENARPAENTSEDGRCQSE